jgi:hypothetical protein
MDAEISKPPTSRRQRDRGPAIISTKWRASCGSRAVALTAAE